MDRLKMQTENIVDENIDFIGKKFPNCIVEAKDATEEQLLIKEINSGMYCANNKILFEALDLVNNNNKANEYYLTDIVEIIGANNKVDTYVVKEAYKLEGFNDVPSLEKAELYVKNLNK